MMKPTMINNKGQLDSIVKKNTKTKASKYVAAGNVLPPNGGSVMYDEAIANQTIKSKLNSIIGKK
jgi:hypothetical protein